MSHSRRKTLPSGVRHRRRVAEQSPTAVLDPPAQAAETAAGSARRAVVHSAFAEATADRKPGRLLVQLIRAGWSDNGVYYPAAVLKRDGAQAWPQGTHLFVDHAPDDDDQRFPVGSLKNLAAWQTSDARWDETRQALVAEVQTYALWREAVDDWARSGAIGLSIRAWVTANHGEAEGRDGLVVEEINAGRSVDFVTRPAAGGRVLAVLESTRPVGEARNIGAWLESRLHLALTQLGDDMYGNGRLTREERIVLSSAIGDALRAYTVRVEADAPQLYRRDLWDDPDGDAVSESAPVSETPVSQMSARLDRALRDRFGGDDKMPVVVDFDPAEQTVWFTVHDRDGSRSWRHRYMADDGGLRLADGDPTEVVARTVWEPVTSAAAESAPNPEPVLPPNAEPLGEAVAAATPAGEPASPSNTPEGNLPDHTEKEEGVVPDTETTTPAAAVEQQPDPTADLRRQITEAQAAAATAARERDEARQQAARYEAVEQARAATQRILDTADSLPAGMRALLAREAVVDPPLTDALGFDEATFTSTLQARVNAVVEALAVDADTAGAGRVVGVGAATTVDPGRAETDRKAMAESYLARGMSEKAAKLAAAGRPI